MKTSLVWLNFLSLLPGTLLTLLTIAVAFLRFYDEQEQRSSAGKGSSPELGSGACEPRSVVSRRSTDDFTLLGQITEPRQASNRLTVAALVVAVVNFGIVERSSCAAWNRRNRETNRLAQEDRRRSEEATRTENERVERRYREIQRDASGSVFRPTRSRSRKRTSSSPSSNPKSRGYSPNTRSTRSQRTIPKSLK